MKFLRRFHRAKSQKPTAYSLIDVGRDQVKAAVVLMVPGNPEPQVVGYGQAETGSHDITGGRIEAGAATRAVNEALTRAEDSTEGYIGQKIVPDDVVFALAGRATVGKLFSINQARPKPLNPISERELKNLRARTERLVRTGLTESTFEGGQWQPLAVTDAGLRLDDRLVLGGVGLTGYDLSFSMFGVAGQASALRAVEVLANRLDLSLTNVVASPQALASIAPYPEAIILDVGLSGTDICLVKDNALVAVDWVPFGGHFFTQTLARAMNVGSITARDLKHRLSQGTLDGLEIEQVEDFLEPARRRWYESVLEVLAELTGDELLPRRIYLTGGGSLLPGLDRLLRTNPDPFDAAPEVLRFGCPPAIKDLTDSMDYDLFALTLSLTVGLPE